MVLLGISTTAGAATLSAADKQKIFEGNALKVYPRLKAQIDKQARGNA